MQQAYMLHEYAMYLVQQCQIRMKFISSSHAACLTESVFESVSNKLQLQQASGLPHWGVLAAAAAALSTSIPSSRDSTNQSLQFRVAPAACEERKQLEATE